jgi:hypothetical protein
LFVVGIGHDGSFLFCLSPNATPNHAASRAGAL